MNKNTTYPRQIVQIDIYTLPDIPFPFPYQAAEARQAYNEFQRRGEADAVSSAKLFKNSALSSIEFWSTQAENRHEASLNSIVCTSDAVFCIQERFEVERRLFEANQ